MLDENLIAVIEIGYNCVFDALKVLWGKGLVDRPPCDVVMDVRGIDNKTIFRGSARIGACLDTKCPGAGERSLIARKRLLDKSRWCAVNDEMRMCEAQAKRSEF